MTAMFATFAAREECRRTLDRLFADVTEKVFATLPDETWVYPGHGGDTTLGNERPLLAEWKSRGW